MSISVHALLAGHIIRMKSLTSIKEFHREENIAVSYCCSCVSLRLLLASHRASVGADLPIGRKLHRALDFKQRHCRAIVKKLVFDSPCFF
jgi:hypothetical protein